MHKRYLGDGVYATAQDGELTLTTGHYKPELADNEIYLSQSELEELMQFLHNWDSKWFRGITDKLLTS